jgi:hypothetical protein
MYVPTYLHVGTVGSCRVGKRVMGVGDNYMPEEEAY